MTSKPKPLYRSLIFWSGIFVMLFIGWAWRDSSMMTSGFNITRYTVMNREGFLGVMAGESNSRMAKKYFRSEQEPATRVQGFPLRRIAFARGEGQAIVEEHIDSIPKTEQGKLIHRMKRFRPEAWILFLPHWLLMLAVAVPWAALLVWRARRVRAALPGR